MTTAATTQIPEGAPDGAPRLHFESYVFDYSPLAEPIILTAETEQAMVHALESGSGAGGALRAMMDTRNRELEREPAVRELVGKVWRASGVNGVQVTLGGTSLDHGWDASIRDIAHYRRRAAAGGDMAICTTADELLAAAADDKVGILLGTQESPIGNDLSKVDLLHDMGVRVMQLTFNVRNLIGDGCTERSPAGLSRFGVEVVKRFDELGMIVDVSHCGYRTTMDAIEVSERPVAITHATCDALAKHSRAKPDDTLRALAERDGYFGVNAVPFFLVPGGGRATLDMVADHVEHAAAIVGIERVGIDTDWALWTPDFPKTLKDITRQKVVVKTGQFDKKEVPAWDDAVGVDGFESWESWPNITAKLLERFSEDDVRGLIGGNWIAFMRRFGL